MNEKQALKLAIECIHEKAEGLSEYANRYHMEPGKWASLRSKHDRYQAYMAAVEILEAMMSQGRLF